MDWGKLITDNFDKVLIFLSGVTGVILGGGITFFVQSWLQDRKRRWALDDQKRIRRRKQLENLQKQHIQAFVPIIQKNILGYSSMSDKELFDFEAALGQLMAIRGGWGFDIELDNLYNNLLREIWNLQTELEVEQSYQVDEKEIYLSHYKILDRINKLIEETYAPPPSLFQRIIKRLTPKRSNNKRPS
jgi:hypothetical protein